MTYLLFERDGIAKMDSELADVDEGVLVGELHVERQHLHQGALHEVNHGQSRGRRELTVLYVRHVHFLK